MDSLIRQFNGDEGTKQAVIAYLTNFISDEAVSRVFAKEDVSSVADAKILIDKAFDQMSIDYGITTQPAEPTNQAR